MPLTQFRHAVPPHLENGANANRATLYPPPTLSDPPHFDLCKKLAVPTIEETRRHPKYEDNANAPTCFRADALGATSGGPHLVKLRGFSWSPPIPEMRLRQRTAPEPDLSSRRQDSGQAWLCLDTKIITTCHFWVV